MSDAPSPFIEGTFFQHSWDSTSLGWLKECDRKYYYSMILGLRRKSLAFSSEEMVHLDFGIAYHKAKELYYKLIAAGQDHEEALDGVVDYILTATWVNGKPWESVHPKKNRDSLLRTVIWNLDKFRDDPAKTILLATGAPAVELSFKFELEGKKLDGNPYLLCGHLDRLAHFGDDPYVFDYKTTGSSIGPYFFEQYNPDNQMSLYTLAARVLYNVPVVGVIVEAAQVLVGTSDFGRGITMRTEAQLEEWISDTHFWFDRAERNVMNKYWPMNDKSCHKYGGCPFREVCSKDPSVRQHFLDTNYVVSPWNPLANRE